MSTPHAFVDSIFGHPEVLPTAGPIEIRQVPMPLRAIIEMMLGQLATQRSEEEEHLCIRCGKRSDDSITVDGPKFVHWLDLCHPCTHWVAGTPVCDTYDPNWREHR